MVFSPWELKFYVKIYWTFNIGWHHEIVNLDPYLWIFVYKIEPIKNGILSMETKILCQNLLDF